MTDNPTFHIFIPKDKKVTFSAVEDDAGAVYGDVDVVVSGINLHRHDNGDVTVTCSRCRERR